MFNRKMEYVIKSVPTDDKQMLEDLLNEMSEEGWDLYTMHEVEGEEDDYQYNCIFMREKEQTDEAEPFDKIVRVNNFKSQMEKMLASSTPTYNLALLLNVSDTDKIAIIILLTTEKSMTWTIRKRVIHKIIKTFLFDKTTRNDSIKTMNEKA